VTCSLAFGTVSCLGVTTLCLAGSIERTPTFIILDHVEQFAQRSKQVREPRENSCVMALQGSLGTQERVILLTPIKTIDDGGDVAAAAAGALTRPLPLMTMGGGAQVLLYALMDLQHHTDLQFSVIGLTDE
jgi:hypothetical protein